jgi:MtN3 and saliva related transmembrane protein
MELATVLGTVAGVLTTAAFVPQVVKTWRTRSARDISGVMFVAFSVGVALWIVYGVLVRAAPVVVANGVTLVLALAILVMKIRFG